MLRVIIRQLKKIWNFWKPRESKSNSSKLLSQASSPSSNVTLRSRSTQIPFLGLMLLKSKSETENQSISWSPKISIPWNYQRKLMRLEQECLKDHTFCVHSKIKTITLLNCPKISCFRILSSTSLLGKMEMVICSIWLIRLEKNETCTSLIKRFHSMATLKTYSQFKVRRRNRIS